MSESAKRQPATSRRQPATSRRQPAAPRRRPAPPLEIAVADDLAEIVQVCGAISAHGEQHRWPEEWVFNLNLALDELITNIIIHGGRAGGHDILLRLTESGDDLIAILEDRGVPFDPFTDAPEPDLEAELPGRKVGGLGVHLVKELMDECAYENRAGRNRVTLKQWQPEDPEESETAQPGEDDDAPA